MPRTSSRSSSSSSSFTSLLVIFLSVINLSTLATAAATPYIPDYLILSPRTTSTVSAATTTCSEYAVIANLSAIGTNSTFRAAFLQAAPFGVFQGADILNTAEKQIKSLVQSKTLNDRCGNSTAKAIIGAATNFSQGIVGEFKVGSNISASGASGLRRMGDWAIVVMIGVVVATGMVGAGALV